MELPKWMLPGGQMWSDPRVQQHWTAVRRVVEAAEAYSQRNVDLPVGFHMPTKEEIIEALSGVMDGVPYTNETDQERKERADYAPIQYPSEFWVILEGVKENNRYDDRPRDWPEWLDWEEFDDRLYEDLPNEREEEEEEDWWEMDVPGTSPWIEFIDDQRSTMVEDMARAAAQGKKWPRHPAFQIVALTALERGKSIPEARKLAFRAYAASFANNIIRAYDNGLVVRVRERDEDGKLVFKYRLLPWRYYELAMDYLWPQAVLVAARKRWMLQTSTWLECFEMVVTAFCNSLV